MTGKPRKKLGGECPYARANLLSKLTFWWLNPLFKVGFKNQLTSEDLYDVLPEDESEHLAGKLERAWEKELQRSETANKEPSFFKALLLGFKKECLIPGIYLFFSEALRLVQPFLIGQLIGYFQPDNELTSVQVYVMAACLGLCSLLQLIFNPLYFFSCHRLAMQMKAAVTAVIYRKILRISSLALHKTTSGQIVNMMSSDVEKISNVSSRKTFNFSWMAPLEIGLVLYLLYRQVNIASFFTLAVIAAVVPLQIFLGWIFGKLRTRIGARSDKRIHMMNEIIAGMRVIKMYCWEKPFSELISKLRKSEITEIWKAAMSKSINISLYLSVSRLLCVVVFIAAWKLGIPLSTKTIYTTIGWIESLRLTVFLFLFFLIEDNTQLAASLKRIQRVLVLDEMKENKDSESGLICTNDDNSDVAMTMRNMTASWTIQQKKTDNSTSPEKSKLIQKEMLESFSMKNISLEIKKGELIAVVGPVGAGKTSLLLTLLGELPSSEGSIEVNGTLGYVSQQPWVVSGTVQENILFGSEYNGDKYREVVQVCALNQDIEVMSNSDQTLVGERGLLLSGGQKARLTLARTIYRNADIYLLDDPLSAVDTEVGRHLFNKCICGYLKDKTRILVTHQLQYLKTVDRIVVLKEGLVIDVGNYDELLAKGTELSTLLSTGHSDKDTHIVTDIEGDKCAGIIKAETPQEKEEDMMSGRVSWRVYWSYLKAGFPVIFIPLLLVLIVCTQVSSVFADWNLARWAESHDLIAFYFSTSPNLSISVNQSQLCQNCSSTVTVVSTVSQYISAGQNMSQYHPANQSTVPSMSLYNSGITSSVAPSIPLYDMLDQTKAYKAIEYHIFLYTVISVCFMVLATIMSKAFFSMCIISGKRLHDMMFRIVLGAHTRFFDSNPVGRILNRFARDISSMDDILPRIFYCVFEIGFRVIALLVTTCIINPWLIVPLVPISISVILIRFYAIQTTRDMKRIEAMNRSPVYSHVSDTLIGLQSIRALNLNKKFVKNFDEYVNRHTIGWFLFLTTYRWFSVRSLFAVVIYMNFVLYMSLILKDVVGVTGGLFGLSLSYCLLLADPFEFFMRMTAELENYMTSVERVTAYTTLEQEAIIRTDKSPPESWPQNADIKFVNVCLRYSVDSPMVLKNINCHIHHKEKIGIVGRTGAGKSSLLASLLRLAEPDGSLFIDGIDVVKIGLHDLRKKISVIPQDPVLFSGNLRGNLDPFNEYNDEQLWRSLEQVQMKDKVDSVPGKLYMEMAEAGHNFSVGQRQLICLARAILRYNKILILDEATANVDRETDELIQQTIRTRFSECTVLTVAHRLHTVMDSDRVMVLDQGELKEFDRPHVLLQNEKSYFKKLVEQTGQGQSEFLHKMALDAYNRIENSINSNGVVS